jgi:hypothetical protein
MTYDLTKFDLALDVKSALSRFSESNVFNQTLLSTAEATRP